MKYRIRVDLSFVSEQDARSLMDVARGMVARAVNINEGAYDEEISHVDLEICRHDEGLPCQPLESMAARRVP